MEITDKNLSDITGKKALLYFSAIWCGPCRTLSPIMEEISAEYSNKGIIIGKVNVDENPEISTKFKIRSIPTLLFITENGEVSEVLVGSQAKSVIELKLNAIIKKDA